MQALLGQMTGPALRALREDGGPGRGLVLDRRRSSIRLKTKVMGLVPVNGVFRGVRGHGTVSADGEVSGTLTVAATAIDTGNARRHATALEVAGSQGTAEVGEGGKNLLAGGVIG